MSLPTIIIFERHWDTIPKSLVKELLPDLSARGYTSLCFEFPQDLTASEIIDRHHSGLEFDSDIEQQAENLLKKVGITTKLSNIMFGELSDLLRLHVSSKRYVAVAEKIKQLPASRIRKEVFIEASKHSIALKGIDIDHKDFDGMISVDVTERMRLIDRRGKYRINTMFQNLLQLRSEQKEGAIFICGALHATGLINEFTKHNLQDQLLYYFTHSSNRYDGSVDDIQMVMNSTLADHTHVLTEKDIKPFSQRVIRDIMEKTKYQQEILEYNAHSQFLSDYFKTNFKAFLRPGHHVDALLDIKEPADMEDIQKRLSAAGIQTHQITMDGGNYLAIPNVNTIEIAERIRKI